MPDLATRLLAMRACPDAVQWARGYTKEHEEVADDPRA